MATADYSSSPPLDPNAKRIEWGIRADLEGPGSPKFTLFKRSVSGYQTVARWQDLTNGVIPEPVLFDMVAAWTQRFTDDLLMSTGVQLVLPSGA